MQRVKSHFMDIDYDFQSKYILSAVEARISGGAEVKPKSEGVGSLSHSRAKGLFWFKTGPGLQT